MSYFEDELTHLNNAPKAKAGLSSAALKNIAIITMVIDHFGAFLAVTVLDYLQFSHGISIVQNYSEFVEILRIIGRIAMPIFCFLLAQGFVYTRDVKAYAMRLAVFALISEVPFDMARNGGFSSYIVFFDMTAQNVFFTLILGILCLCVIKYIDTNVVFKILLITFIAFLSEVLRADYGAFGVLTIVLFYVLRHNLKSMLGIMLLWLGFGYFLRITAQLLSVGYGFSAAFVAAMSVGFIQSAGTLSLIFIAMYNGEKGEQLPKYFFYAFYPAHLLIIYFVRLMLI